MLNDVFLLQNLSLVTLCFFVSTYNILTLWYLAGIYLVLLGCFLMLDDGDIFVGFLWVIDLGVGLVFLFLFYIIQPFYTKKLLLTSQLESFVLWFLLYSSLYFFYFSLRALLIYIMFVASRKPDFF